MTRNRSFVALMGVLLCATLAHAGSGRLRSDGQWIRDARGRVILLRGVNYSGLEFGNFFAAPHPPEESDFEQMATWGVNVVRLPKRMPPATTFTLSTTVRARFNSSGASFGHSDRKSVV